MVHTQLYSESFPENINDLRSPSNYPFVGMLYDDSSLLYSYESIIKQNDNEILYKAPLVQDVEYINNGVDTSIHINILEITPTNTDYNILQFNYSNSNDKILSGRFDAGNGGHEFYCLQSNGITELVLPNGIEEIDALALNCPNLTTVTLPSSIKRFRSVTYDNPWTEEGDVTKTLIFGSKIETIYFDGTMNEWKAIDKNTNWIPIGKIVRVICHDYFLKVTNIPSVDIEAQPREPGGSIEK
jgi:hypothetical protein